MQQKLSWKILARTAILKFHDFLVIFKSGPNSTSKVRRDRRLVGCLTRHRDYRTLCSSWPCWSDGRTGTGPAQVPNSHRSNTGGCTPFLQQLKNTPESRGNKQKLVSKLTILIYTFLSKAISVGVWFKDTTTVNFGCLSGLRDSQCLQLLHISALGHCVCAATVCF